MTLGNALIDMAVDGTLSLTDQEFAMIRDLVYQRLGIHLTDRKRTLVVSRLRSLLREHQFSTFGEYYNYVRQDTTGVALDALANRITTNYTYFCREKAHFDFFLSTALPEAVAALEQNGRHELRVWCAACSTGEEAYMLAILLLEYFRDGRRSWDTGVLASDVSRRALEKARAGIYADGQVARVPPALRNRYFIKLGGGQWQVCPAVRKQVTFRRFNLINTRYPFKLPFHIIFCRNVMIYFDQSTRRELVRRLFQFTEPGGYLFIGHTETIERDSTSYRTVIPAAYRREAK